MKKHLSLTFSTVLTSPIPVLSTPLCCSLAHKTHPAPGIQTLPLGFRPCPLLGLHSLGVFLLPSEGLWLGKRTKQWEILTGNL